MQHRTPHTARPFRSLLAIVVATSFAGTALAQVPAVRLQRAVPVPSAPAQPAMTVPVAPTAAPVVAPPPGPGAASNLSSQEVADLKREYDASTEEERAALREYLKAMGIDLDRALGLTGAAAAPVAQTLLQAVQAMDFARTPQAVLAARSKLGFQAAPAPDRADVPGTAEWIQLQVMAGEWDAFAAFLGGLSDSDAQGVYAHVLQSMNRPPKGNPNNKPDPALLPEDVLALADAAPGELSDWQFDVLAQLLRTAATKYSTGPMLAAIQAGTRLFGPQGEASRARTVRFLVAADLVVDAYAYFPPLDEARQRNDARALLNHGRYQQDLAESPRGAQEHDRLLRNAWSLFGEVTLMDEAEAALRQDALRRAIDLLPSMPPAPATAWLEEVFARPSLGPAALEVIALKAVSLRDANLDEAERAQTILTMKESVDILLAQEGVDIRQLRVPLRMLTTALIGEAEAALNPSGPRQRQGNAGNSAETQLLLRALPDENWLGALEPSLASRAYQTAIGVALAADEVDLALDYLAAAVRRFPTDGVDFADRFLQGWEKRMVRPSDMFNDQMFFYGFVQNQMPAAPLTRGRQRRNLDRLARLMAVLDSIGVDSRRLPSVAAVFKACHGQTEIFTRDGIERVFGPIDQIDPTTSASLADQMRSGLSGDWRDRQAQQAAGMKRSGAEISRMVEDGYGLALELIDRSLAADPESWRYAVTKAALAFDRVEFKQSESKQDFAAYNQYRKEAFAAFAQTAERYADLVRRGDQRDDPSVYLAWFNAAVGATELNYLTRDDLLVEGSPQDDQIDLIRKALQALPPDASNRHVAAFAQVIEGALPRLAPEIKPRVVRHAMRIVGDNPGGAALRRLADLYQDLVKDEIKLRLVVDGDDRVGAERRFGATLTLRFTTAVDRETGGFSRYLQNDVWARVGNSYRPMNHRDQLQKDFESALRERFDIETIGFFEALAPPLPVVEGGEEGWLEKPLAYAVLKARDPSVDRVPAVTMDLLFNDTLGPVTLPVASNAPLIDAAGAPDRRPVRNLEVVQTVDLREIDNPDKDRAVTLEVQAKGQGVLPELDDLLPGVRTALPGYDVAATGIEARPVGVVQNDADWQASRFVMSPARDTTEYTKPDESGIYRLTTERSWLVTYTPTGGTVGDAFAFPTLPSGLDGTLTSRQYTDMDIVPVATASVAVHPSPWSRRNLLVLGGLVAVAVVGAVFFLRRRRTVGVSDEAIALPERITPLSVVATLRRIERDPAHALDANQRQSLDREIAVIEAKYFGPEGGGAEGSTGNAQNGAELRTVLERWMGAGAAG